MVFVYLLYPDAFRIPVTFPVKEVRIDFFNCNICMDDYAGYGGLQDSSINTPTKFMAASVHRVFLYRNGIKLADREKREHREMPKVPVMPFRSCFYSIFMLVRIKG